MANSIVMYKFWDTRNIYHPKWNWGLFKHNDGFFMESEAYHIELPENVVLAENNFGETCLFLVEKDKETMCQLDIFSSPKGSCPLLVGPNMYKYLSYFLNEIRDIAVSLLEPYHTHTFAVSVTEDFKESIQRMGVIEPLLIAQSTNYGKYEVISGHRRLEAAKAVGLTTLPCRIAREDTPREILDEVMVITNLQRRNTFTKMELARSLKLLNDSRKKQGFRTDIMIDGNGSSTKAELAEEFGISVKKLYMLISFTQLSDFFAKKVDDNTLADKVAYCLSFLSEYEQHIVEEYLNSNPNYVLTADKAERLKDKKNKDTVL